MIIYQGKKSHLENAWNIKIIYFKIEKIKTEKK